MNWDDDYFWNLTSNHRTFNYSNPIGFGSIEKFFNRLEKMLKDSHIEIERKRTISFVVTEGDNEAIDRAIAMLESMRSTQEEDEEDGTKRETESGKESKFTEDFKDENA